MAYSHSHSKAILLLLYFIRVEIARMQHCAMSGLRLKIKSRYIFKMQIVLKGIFFWGGADKTNVRVVGNDLSIR